MVVVAIVVDVVLCFAGDVEQVDVVAGLDGHVGVADVVGQITKLHASATIEIRWIRVSLLGLTQYDTTLVIDLDIIVAWLVEGVLTT